MGHLADIIEEGSGPSEKLRLYRFLIESFLPELVKVDPSDLLPHLECLTDEDKEEIMNLQTQHTSAMVESAGTGIKKNPQQEISFCNSRSGR